MKYAFIMGENFEETEAVTAIDLLRRAGVEIDIYGIGSSSVKGRSGLTIITDRIFNNEADLDISEYGGILIPGGPGASRLAVNKSLLNIVRGFNSANKLIYAICAAPMDWTGPAYSAAKIIHASRELKYRRVKGSMTGW